MTKRQIQRLVIAAVCLCLGLVLPFITGQLQSVNKIISPMHYSVLICGFICGWKYGFCIGFITPIIRSVIFSMPPIYPRAVEMAFELAIYGLVSGLIYTTAKKQTVLRLYLALVVAMVSGRLMLGVVRAVLLGFAGDAFLLKAFLTTAFVEDIPGIAIQLVVIPAVVVIIKKAFPLFNSKISEVSND